MAVSKDLSKKGKWNKADISRKVAVVASMLLYDQKDFEKIE